MGRAHLRRSGSAAGVALGIGLLLCAASASPVRAGVQLPTPAPDAVLGRRHLRTPPIDPVSVCVPSRVDRALADRAEQAARRPDTARVAASELRADREARDGDRALVADLLFARAARDPGLLHQATTTLATRRARVVDDEARACVQAERARIELLMGRLPEAAAYARLARTAAQRLSRADGIARVADLYRAEAFYRSGRLGLARTLYRRLSAAPELGLAAAARLRFADVLFDTGERSGARIDYEALLPDAEEMGASLAGWGLRVVESALADADLEAARGWIQQILAAAPPPEIEGSARLRLADIHATEGRTDAARTELEAVIAEQPDSPLGDFARLRMAGLDSPSPDAERLEGLRALTGSAHAMIAAYARLVLGQELLAREQPSAALDELARVAFSPGSHAFQPSLRHALDAALAQVAAATDAPEPCADFVEQVGWRRGLLSRQAGRPGPFVALGGCYGRLGLPRLELRVYRTVAERFGRDGVERIALPMARASLALGDVERARRAAIDRAGLEGPERDRWQLLRSEIEMFEGRYAQAADVLQLLVSGGRPAPLPERIDAISLLARAATHLGRTTEYRGLLADAIARIDADQQRLRGADLGEAALVAAEGHRRAQQLGRARDLYQLAYAILPRGSRRDEAAYWIDSLQPELSSTFPQGTPGPAPLTADTSVWYQLAAAQQRVDELRRRIRQPLQAASPP